MREERIHVSFVQRVFYPLFPHTIFQTHYVNCYERTILSAENNCYIGVTYYFNVKKRKVEDWEEKDDYAGYKIIGKGNKRRIIEKDTGKIIIEYTV